MRGVENGTKKPGRTDLIKRKMKSVYDSIWLKTYYKSYICKPQVYNFLLTGRNNSINKKYYSKW